MNGSWTGNVHHFSPGVLWLGGVSGGGLVAALSCIQYGGTILLTSPTAAQTDCSEDLQRPCDTACDPV